MPNAGIRWLVSAEAVFDTILNAPTIEPRKGKWIKDEEASDHHAESIYVCSACNNMDAWGEVEKNTFKFCPNCGADMRGDNDEI